MNRPRIFVSAVSEELRTLRRAAANTLHKMGYDTVSQDDFPTGHGELREWLRQQIDSCEGLLQLVGEGYGAEPPQPDPIHGRVSYTQWEFLYAQEQKKKTWIFVVDGDYKRDKPAKLFYRLISCWLNWAGTECKQDKPVKQLDLPPLDHPNPAAYQAERRVLQHAYRARLQQDNHLRHHFNSQTELENLILKLRDELAELRREADDRYLNTIRTLNNIDVRVQSLIEAKWNDTKTIRTHLEQTIEQTRKSELAEAEKITHWDDRQKRREAVEEEHAAKLAQIDDTIRWITSPDTTDIAREMIRVLEEQGAEAALDYIATQKPEIIRRVTARAAATREHNRRELRPLLTAAQLEYNRGHTDSARQNYENVMTLESEWTEALTAYGRFLHTQIEQEKIHGSLAQALKDASRLLALAERLPTASSPNLANACLLPAALQEMGDALLLRRSPGDTEQAFSHYQRSLAILEALEQANPQSGQAQRNVSLNLNRLGDFLATRGLSGDAEQALGYYQRGLAISEALEQANSQSGEIKRDVSVSLERLGDFLAKRNLPGDREQALGYFQRSLVIREELKKVNPQSAKAKRDMSVNLEKLGDVLIKRPSGDTDQALSYYQRSLVIREALQQATPQSAEAKRDVSVSLEKLGDCMAKRGDIEEALSYYQSSLVIREALEKANPQSSQAKRDVATLHGKLAVFFAQQGHEKVATASGEKCFTMLDAFDREGRMMDAEMRRLYSQLKPMFAPP